MPLSPVPRPDVVDRIERAFAARQWRVFDYQRDVWRAQAKGESGLIHAPTGTGKTLAAWIGLLADPKRCDEGLSVLWITPMRALATDTTAGLQSACRDIDLDWRVEQRTGDTSSHVRARQRRKLPNALVTTPESASLLLSYADLIPAFANLRAVIVDEWHELIGSKRGVQTELVLSRLRALSPRLVTWGLSATLGNLDQAMRALLGPQKKGRCISGQIDKRIVIETLLPDVAERFPWSGHMGLGQVSRVVEAIRRARTSLLFTNTRSQAERWFEKLSAVCDPPLRVALHHGSLDPALRAAAEDGLRQGTLDAVVATSSLDLGVDFTPVDQVIQLGGPKGIARLLQRAGRSGHRPGQVSRIVCVPTQAIEIAEFAAAREAASEGTVEARVPLTDSLDVLAQHIVTLALSARVTAAQIRREISATHAYAGLDEGDWNWVMDFVTRGGSALAAYPQYRKVAEDADGCLHVPDATLARRHRMAIGTISSDPQVRVAFVRGSSLGTVEESFVSRLRPGDSFVFAGKRLTLVRVHEMVAQVKAGGGGTQVPRWLGGKSPLSSELSDRLLRLIAEFDPKHPNKKKHASRDPATVAELATLAPLLEIQSRWSGLPLPGSLLVERTRTREGEHLYCYPFAGRHAHEGLSALVAWRLSQRRRASFVFSVNDYGFELLSRELPDLEPDEIRTLFSPENLDADLVASINASEMARRRFREIARIAGLVFEGHPGQRKTLRQVQASSGLIFDTLTRYDPDNRLTKQALHEALDHLLDVRRLRVTAERLHASPVVVHRTEQLTPLAFPLWAERLSSQQLTSEDTRTRIERMLEALEIAAGGTRGPPLPPPLEAAPSAPKQRNRERDPRKKRPRRRRLRL